MTKRTDMNLNAGGIIGALIPVAVVAAHAIMVQGVSPKELVTSASREYHVLILIMLPGAVLGNWLWKRCFGTNDASDFVEADVPKMPAVPVKSIGRAVAIGLGIFLLLMACFAALILYATGETDSAQRGHPKGIGRITSGSADGGQ